MVEGQSHEGLEEEEPTPYVVVMVVHGKKDFCPNIHQLEIFARISLPILQLKATSLHDLTVFALQRWVVVRYGRVQ